MDKKTIVVVGAGQGLGNHVARRFGKAGFRVVLMARKGESLKHYQQEFAADGIETHVHKADAERPETLADAFAWVKERLGTPDILVYNVGHNGGGRTGQDDECRADASLSGRRCECLALCKVGG